MGAGHSERTCPVRSYPPIMTLIAVRVAPAGKGTQPNRNRLAEHNLFVLCSKSASREQTRFAAVTAFVRVPSALVVSWGCGDATAYVSRQLARSASPGLCFECTPYLVRSRGVARCDANPRQPVA